MAKVQGNAATSAAAAPKGAGKVDKAAERAKQAAAKQAEKEKLAKQKEAEKAKAEKEAAKKKAADERAKAKAEKEAERAKKKEEREKAKAEKEAAKNKPPEWVTQLDEKGNPEQVDKNKYPFEVKCAYPGCEEIRYVNQSGLLLVTMCKPHARKERRKRRMAKVRARTANYKNVVKEALEKGYFPDAFRKKHGL